ncbi:MAG: hypothetical protein A2W99_02980 [Bacteroidetes bacterium GWF2_33_16]|nr:MAG: hypothetical protein A2X00_10035 [Bacteroidetes bacterium GWE2_32_14]OFY07858.1 MAG: hypothetical protein A2W99_02980 [Bacteroidetes bacterium GWF2_33_16]
MRKYKILYIDDQKVNLMLFSEYYQDEYIVLTADSGFEGLEIIKKENVDLIISDQAMPNMTGVEFFEQALKVDPGPNRILLTAFNDLNALAEAVNRAKIFRYVKKPYTREDLKIIIDSAILEYVLRKENEELTIKLKNQTQELSESVRIKSELLAELEESKIELEKGEKKLRRIIEFSPMPIAISDLENVNVVLNAQFIRTFGYNIDDIPTLNEWYIRAYPDKSYRENHIKKWNDQLAIAVKNNTVMESIESIVQCKNGDKKTIQIKATIIGDNQVAIFNDLTKIRSLEKDISYRIQMEEEILKAKTSAESANRAKSEFIANMSHEIRTPMNAILGFAEVLGQEITNSSQMEYIRSIQNSGKTLLSLINDILDFSKIEAGKIEIRNDLVNLRYLIQEIADVFKFRIREKNIEFITDVDPDLPTNIIIDELRIKQILLNLVNNAIKFTHEGFIKITVIVKNLTINSVNIIMKVEDSGIGIEKNKQMKIFDVFEQIENEDSRKYEGTGLGLAITRKLTHMLGGEIKLISEKGKGSEFIVSLDNIKISKDKNLVSRNKPLKHELINFKESKILVVDDIEDNRQIIKLYLRKFNFEVFEASDGYEALEKIKVQEPDLIFMDLLMPNLDGYETLKKMQQNPAWDKIPVIAITAYTMNNEKQQVLHMGFVDYLSKPIDYKQMNSILMKYLSTTTIDNEIAKVENTQIIDRIDPEKLIPLQNELEINILPLFKQLAKIRPKKIVNELGELAVDLGNKYNLNSLQNFGNEILNASKSFNVEKEKELLFELEKLVLRIIGNRD